MIWFVAGINGAGKSTVSENALLLTLMGVRSVINPDLIAREIARTCNIDYALANLSAAIMTQSMVFNEAILSDTPVIAMETVLSTAKYNPILDIASQRGFEVGLIYVSVQNVELTLKRIETRTAAGLHNVPEDDSPEALEKDFTKLCCLGTPGRQVSRAGQQWFGRARGAGGTEGQ